MTPLISLIESIDPGNVARQVANAHTIFNISVTLVLLPLAKYLVLLANKLLPGDEVIEKDGAIYLDKNLLKHLL